MSIHKIAELHNRKTELEPIMKQWYQDNPDEDLPYDSNIEKNAWELTSINYTLKNLKQYLVGGKGFYTINTDGTPKETFTVPKDCCIVLTTIEESTITDDKPLLVHYMEYYQKLFQKDLDTLKKPKII